MNYKEQELLLATILYILGAGSFWGAVITKDAPWLFGGTVLISIGSALYWELIKDTWKVSLGIHSFRLLKCLY